MNSYLQLASQLYALYAKSSALYKQLRETKDPAQYAALLEQIEDVAADIKTVSVEIRALVNAGNVTEADITAAHARNQQVPVDNDAPEAPPAGAEYFKGFPFPVPENDELLGRGYVAGNDVQVNTDETEWRIANKSIGGSGWHFLRTIS